VPSIPNQAALLFIKIYKKGVSPFLPQACRFMPSCSAYARGCFERHGFLKALFLSAKRLMRCHPLCAGGFDPVPENGKSSL
jgi:putative membrane protein insertion efficiency factor